MNKRFQTFTVLINRISRNIRKIKIQEMAEYNLKSAHISCLYYLYSQEGLTATELCELCEEDKATISRALEYLESNGYLIGDTANAKRYKSPFNLTEKGKEVGGKISGKIDEVLKAMSLSLNEEDRLRFYNSLSIISNSLEQICSEKGSK